MNTLIYIGLIYIFSYHCSENCRNFRGSSYQARNLIGLIGRIGITIFYATLIWSFWHFAWWQPIVNYVVAIFVGGLSTPLFQGNVFGVIASPFLVIVFSFLSVFSLL